MRTRSKLLTRLINMMKRRQINHLASLNLKSRKKSTIATIIGIIFSCTLLFPILFLGLGFFLGLEIYVNQDPESKVFNVKFYSEQYESYEIYSINDEYKEQIVNNNHASKTLYVQSLAINKNLTYQLEGDAEEYKSIHYSEELINFDVVDVSSTNGNPFLSSDYEPLVAGNVFSSGNSKGEIMLSNNFLKAANLTEEDVLGKKISLSSVIGIYKNTYPNCANSTDDPTMQDLLLEENGYRYDIVHKFTIVGIYNARIYNSATARLRNQGRKGNMFWITTDSLQYNDPDIAYPLKIEKPVAGSSQKQYWYYYPRRLKLFSNECAVKGYACLLYGAGVNCGLTSRAGVGFYDGSLFLDYFSYANAVNDYEMINNCYLNSSPLSNKNEVINKSRFCNYAFSNYYSFYKTFSSISIVLLMVALVIFIGTLLNLYNTLQFSVEYSRGALGMCRAIGMRKKDVSRLYSTQIYIILFYSFIFITTIGVGLCILIKYLFDNVFMENNATRSAFTLEWWFIPIAFGVLLLINYLASILITKIVVHSFNKQPILEILSEENK